MERLRAALDEEGIDVLLCFKQENSFYLTEFNPGTYSHHTIGILTKNSAVPALLASTLRKAKANLVEGSVEVFTYGTWWGVGGVAETWQDALVAVVKGKVALNGLKIGIDQELEGRDRDELEKLFPGAKLINASALIQTSRNTKDEDELQYGDIAGKLCEAAMAAMGDALLNDDEPNEQKTVRAALVAVFDVFMAKYPHVKLMGFGSREGANLINVNPWVLAGDRRFLQFDGPEPDLIQNKAVAAAIWVSVNGRHAELEHTFCIGKVSKAQTRALDVVQRVTDELLAMVKPGVAIAALAAHSEKRLTEFGYASAGRIGHGIGIGAHEDMSINKSNATVLAPGMVITVEPNVKVPAEKVATQESVTIRVTHDGYRFVAHFEEKKK